MEVEATFYSGLGEEWNVPGSYFVSLEAGQEELQALVNQVLGKNDELGFCVNDHPVVTSLEEVMTKLQISTEAGVRIEFYVRIPPICSNDESNAQDWVSAVKIASEVVEGVIAADYSGSLTLHHNSSVKLTKQISGTPLKSIDLSPSGILSCSLSGDYFLTDYDFTILAKGKTERLEAIAWSPLESGFALGSSSGSLALGKLSDGELTKGLKRQKMSQETLQSSSLSISHTDKVSGLSWPCLETLVSASWDHQILSTDLEKVSIESSVLCPRAIQAFKYLGNLALAGFENGFIYGYDMRSTGKTLTFNCKSWVRAVNISGNAVVAGTESGKLQIFDMRSSQLSHELQAHEGKTMSIDCKDLLVTSGGSDNVVKQYNFEN